MNWQSIDTAPRDGTFILAVCEGTYDVDHYWIPAVVQWKEGSWHEVDDEDDYELEDDWDLTHWMPLPENPAKGKHNNPL